MVQQCEHMRRTTKRAGRQTEVGMVALGFGEPTTVVLLKTYPAHRKTTFGSDRRVCHDGEREEHGERQTLMFSITIC